MPSLLIFHNCILMNDRYERSLMAAALSGKVYKPIQQETVPCWFFGVQILPCSFVQVEYQFLQTIIANINAFFIIGQINTNQKVFVIIVVYMNSQTTQKQIVYWNILTLNHLASVIDLMDRCEKKVTPAKHDFKMRDFYFKPSFDFFGFKTKPTFIEESAEIIKNFVSFNQEGYLQSLSFQHLMAKHRYWTKIYKLHIKNKQDHEAKQTVRNIVWTYRLIPVTFFIFAAATILRVSGVYKMSYKKQAVGLIAGTILGDIFIRTKKSSQIFYLIPPLHSPQLEDERLTLLNKSIVLDGKINQIQLHPSYVDQLIEQADKQTNFDQKKLILQTAGYTVVDRIDYQY